MHYKVLIRVATSRGLVWLGHGTPLGGDTGVARFCKLERKAGEGVNGVYTAHARSQKDIKIQGHKSPAWALCVVVPILSFVYCRNANIAT